LDELKSVGQKVVHALADRRSWKQRQLMTERPRINPASLPLTQQPSRIADAVR
jgi:hypothetical protein